MIIEFVFYITLGTLFPPHWPQWSDWTTLGGISALQVEAGLKRKDPVSDGIINYAKAFDNVDHNKLWKILQEMGISSVAQSCLTLCDPMDCIMPRFPVHHQFLELAQTHTQ